MAEWKPETGNVLRGDRDERSAAGRLRTTPFGVLLAGALALFVLGRPSTADPLAVRVTDVDGRPIGGAVVACLDPAGSVATTGEAGLARLDADCRSATCRADGFLEAPVDLAGGVRTCRLVRGLVLSGSVVGDPCADCELLLVRPADPDGTPVARASAQAPGPDSLPAFGLPAVPAGVYGLRIRSARQEWACRRTLPPYGPGSVEVVVPWRAPVFARGVVLDEESEPLSGLPVQARSGQPPRRRDAPGLPADAGWRCGPDAAATTTTAPDGAFRVSIDPAGETLIVAGSWMDPHGVAAAVVSGAGPSPLRLVPERPARVVARVVDEQGLPLEVHGVLEPDDPEARWLAELIGGDLEADADENGRLALGPFRARSATLRIVADGMLPVVRRLDAPAPGQTLDLGEIVAERGASLEVVVLDPDLRPVVGARVVARAHAGAVLAVEQTSDADGRVLLHGLPPEAVVGLEVRAPGFVTALRAGVRLPGDPVEIVLEPGASVSGLVTTPWGEPVGGAQVSGMGKGAGDRRRTDDGGRFELIGLPAGRVRLMVEAAGYASRQVTLELGPREHRGGVVITLEPAPVIEGRVVAPDGTPVAGARVALLEGWALAAGGLAMARASTTSAADGRFDLHVEPPPGARLVAVADGFGPAEAPAPVGGTPGEPVELRLARAARLRAHLPPEAGPAARVRVVDGIGLSREVSAGGARVVEIGGLAPGLGRAALVPGTGQPVELVPGETVDVELRSGATIQGVVTAEGIPVPRAAVSLTAVGGSAGLENRGVELSDAEGRFRFDGVPRGRYLLVAQTATGRAERSLAIAADERLEIDLSIERITLAVHVRDAKTEAPIARAAVTVSRADHEGGCSRIATSSFAPGGLGFEMNVSTCGGARSSTAGDGTAMVAVAEPGRYVLRVTAEGHDPARQIVELEPGDQRVEVRLTPARRTARVRAHLVTDPPGALGAFVCITPGATNAMLLADEGTCEDLEPGPVTVLFLVPGFGSVRTGLEVEAGEDREITLRPRRGGTLVIPVATLDAARPVVRDAAGTDWAELFSRFRFPGLEPVRITEVPDVGPAWVLADLPPGTYTAEVAGAVRKPVAVTAAERAVAW